MTGDKLREIRIKFGMTQLDLSGLAGVTRQTVGDWERDFAPIPEFFGRVMSVVDDIPELFEIIYPEHAEIQKQERRRQRLARRRELWRKRKAMRK